MFLRFLRFNVVGALGVAVQIASLALLVSVLGVHYLPATAIAIELSVLHNFLWHERWTWGDRTGSGNARRRQAAGGRREAGGEVPRADCGTRAAGFGGTRGGARRRAALGRLVAFHAGNGAVSMIGSLVLMPVFVAWLGLHYLVANLGTIAATGLFNFLVGDRLIFRAERRSPAGPGPRREAHHSTP